MVLNSIYIGLYISLILILPMGCGGGFGSATKKDLTLPSSSSKKVWNFDVGSEYNFDSDQVEVSGGVARIKEVAFLINNETTFDTGTYIGTEYIASAPLGYLQLDVDGAGTPTNGLTASVTPYFTDLVGYWALEGNFTDGSTEGNDGAAVGDVTSDLAIFKVGLQSATFDKVGDAIFVPDDDSLDVQLATSFTISTWVRFDDLTLEQRFISKACYNGAAWENSSYTLGKEVSNLLSFQLSSDGINYGAILSSSQMVKVNEWYHVVATYDGANVRLYVNGVENDSTAFTNPVFNSTIPLHLGARSDGFGCGALDAELSGNLDDVAIWKQPLSALNILEVYNHQKQKYSGQYISRVVDAGGDLAWASLSWVTSLPFMKEVGGDIDNNGLADSESTGDATNPIYPKLVGNSGTLSGNNLLNNLILYYKLNGLSAYTGTPGEVPDASGGGAIGGPPTPNNGVAVGGGINFSAGVHNEGRRFDGSGTRIQVNTFAANPTFTGAKTISFWIKLDSTQATTTSTTNTIYVDGDGTRSTLVGYHNQTAAGVDIGKIFFQNDDGVAVPTPTITSTKRLNDGEFHHIVLRQDAGGNMELFIDGVTDGTVINSTSGAYGGAYTMTINAAANSFSGDIDEIAVWRRALHPTQVLQLYQRGANRIKLQVKSCVESTCQCRVLAGSDPNDCDNDAIVNSLDPTDTNQAVWLGPTGTSLTYFSELHNNTTISAAGKGTGIVRRESPSLSYATFLGSGLNITDNRYFQVRLLMESGSAGLICSGAACVPELTSLSMGMGNLFAGVVEIESSVAYTYSGSFAAIDFEESGVLPACEYNYRLSNDNGVNWYYHDSGNWVVATQDPPGPPTPHYNNAGEVRTHIGSFTSSLGAGTGQFKFKAFIQSTDATTPCDLDRIEVSLSE